MIARFLFISTGAFAIWMTKGFKGPFDKEMIRIDDNISVKGTTRYFLGLGIWIGILIIASVLLTRPSKQSVYKIKTNKKGEIIEMEEVK